LILATGSDRPWLIGQHVRAARLIAERSLLERLDDVARALKYRAQFGAFDVTCRLEREWLSGGSMTDDEPAKRV